MKIRTELDLQNIVDKEMAWRKRELISIKSTVETSRKFAHNTSLRSGIAMVYAHWEGGIKNIATYYLCHVSCQKLKYCELKRNFLSLAIRNELGIFEKTNKATLHNEIVDSVFNKMEEKANLPYENIVKTASNLNSEVFKEIMALIGLSDEQYSSSYNLIDEVLLKQRNQIAHGDRLDIINLDKERFIEIYGKILELLELFSTQVMNSAAIKDYRVSD